MKILLIDTCGEMGTVTLADVEAVSAPVTATLPGRAASERLIPTIRDLVGSLNSLSAIAVVYGPGSFTGVRVGLSAAKGLCEALSLPLIALSRLAVVAHAAGLDPAIRTHAILDAGRGEFYLGIYRDGIRLREALVTRDELLAEIAKVPNESAAVVCEPPVAESLAILTPRLIAPPPSAEAALPLALSRFQARLFVDAASIDANYLRRTDAEIFAKSSVKLSPAEAPLP